MSASGSCRVIWPVAVALTVAGPSVVLTATAGKLGAGNFRDREVANRTLLAAGPHAVGPLTTALRSADPEVRRRAATLLDRIEADRLGAPTLVSLRADRRPVADVVADLTRQTGYRLGVAGEAADRRVTVHLDRVPFWAAVDAVRQAAGLAAHLPTDGQIELHPCDGIDHCVSYAGPFRLVVTTVASSQSVQLVQAPRRLPPREPDPMSVSFHLTAEPKAPVVSAGEMTVHEARDDRGANLRATTDVVRASYYGPSVGERAAVHPLAIALTRPDRSATHIRTLRGVVPVVVLAGTTPDVIVHDPAAAVGRTVRGAQTALTVDRVVTADGQVTVTVTLARPAGAGGDWEASAAKRLELADADGRGWGFGGIQTQSAGPRGLTVGVLFRPPGGGATPARLTLVEWRTVPRDLAFEFRDLPLP